MLKVLATVEGKRERERDERTVCVWQIVEGQPSNLVE
jgi:hypothetical protein